MSEAHQQAPPGSARSSERIDAICNVFRKGVERLSDALTPPEAASKHFREARIEVLRGIRELIDYRIDRLSRSHTQGTRVTVE
jgi:hypothetical protein